MFKQAITLDRTQKNHFRFTDTVMNQTTNKSDERMTVQEKEEKRDWKQNIFEGVHKEITWKKLIFQQQNEANK